MKNCMCGSKETKVVGSLAGAFSDAYCEDCIEKGRESYSVLVSMMTLYEDLSFPYQRMVDHFIETEGKTIEDFNASVEVLFDQYAKNC